MTTATYCKRLRMEVDLEWIDPAPPLPPAFVWVPWDEATLPTHADVMWQSFRREVDGRIFPNLAEHDGCVELMREITGRPGFVPDATWLVSATEGCCGTVQGLLVEGGLGMIQNLGVLADYRGLGLGRALLLRCLHGFRAVGLRRAFLEVTARNTRAVRLYHQAGFVVRKSFFRGLAPAVEDWYFI